MHDVAADVDAAFTHVFGSAHGARAWFVPGRIEVLGKHTDYAGGRSLLATVDRGFHVLARPRDDARVRLLAVETGEVAELALDPPPAPRPGHWTDYPVSVLRRLPRDHPEVGWRGMEFAFRSTLPVASGLSSSSALVIATYLPLAAFNALDGATTYRAAIADRSALAGYLGAVENGKAFGPFPGDFGVGTQGGSEDHLAILACEPGELLQARFLPVAEERRIAVPDGWAFVVAASGVHAAKGGAVQAHYNALAGETAELLRHAEPALGAPYVSLLDALESAPDAEARLAREVRRRAAEAERLLARLGQFREESVEIIPAVVEALVRGDVAAAGPLVARSHEMAETVLRNQVPETMWLVREARRLGAAAASAFGAGFGGAVWALAPAGEAEALAARWMAGYAEAFVGRGGEAWVVGSAQGRGP
ncbi:MAG: galactokinase family protein [Gemmatimonadales bacterium]|nr:galactokinase family protein [Gemmatimonadales bacterium]